MSDKSISSEGAQPPNEGEGEALVARETILRRRRSRKLSGLEARALGELAFAMYEVCAMALPSERKWDMLRSKLLAWRGRYL